MLRFLLTAACLALPLPAMAQDLPEALRAFAAEQSRACSAMGGDPRVGPAFATAVDLTGDGALDYVVDLAGIECANAWSAFCGSAGCPVSVWIARSGGLVREWADYAQAWTVEGLGADMAVVVEQHGAACDAAGGAACSQRLVFAAAPAAPPAADDGGAVAPEANGGAVAPADDGGAVAPEAESGAVAPEAPPAAPAAPAAALAAPGIEGWTLRDVPDSTPVAVSDGPGAIASVALFCLAEQPWLALGFRAPPAGATAEVDFAFAGSRATAEARREDSAGGAFVIALADLPLAALLAGRDASVRVVVDGVEQGVLSLRGSTRAIRGALEACMRF